MKQETLVFRAFLWLRIGEIITRNSGICGILFPWLRMREIKARNSSILAFPWLRIWEIKAKNPRYLDYSRGFDWGKLNQENQAILSIFVASYEVN